MFISQKHTRWLLAGLLLMVLTGCAVYVEPGGSLGSLGCKCGRG